MDLLSYHLTLLPHFFWILIQSFVLFSGLSGVFLLIRTIRKDLVYSTASVFLSIVFYVLLSWVVVADTESPINSLRIFTIVFFLPSLLGWSLWVRDHAKKIPLHRLSILLTLFFTLVLTYFLVSFTYDNGLHDEYFHHAIIEDFIKTNSFPFLDPYRTDAKLRGYHFGLYFPVLAGKILFSLSSEDALDVAKIMLFLPALACISYLCSRLFGFLYTTSLVLTSTAFVIGPSLFFLDTFTQNVFTGARNPQLFTPILFEYAGLTWHAFTFFLVFIFIALLVERKQKRLSVLTSSLFFMLTIFSMVSINQVFFLLYVGTLGIITFWKLMKSSDKRQLLIPGIVFLLSVSLSLTWLVSERKAADARTTPAGTDTRLHPGESATLRVFRPQNRIGIPYLDETKAIDAVSRLSYARIQDSFFWRSIGIGWLVSLVLFCNHQRMKLRKVELLSIVLFLFLVLVPVTVYVFLFPTDDLALNKFLRPAFFLLPFIFYVYSRNVKKHIQILLLLVLGFGSVSPLYFFMTGRFAGFQRPWVVSSKEEKDLLWFFDRQTTGVVQVQTNSHLVQEMLANSRPMQVEICTTNCGVKETIDVIVREKSTNLGVSDDRKVVFESEKYLVYQ